MIGFKRRLLMMPAAAIGVVNAVSTYAVAHAPLRSIGNNEGILIDGRR